ncbi:helix-turn-helix transcriptional regulator [Leifsonia sp. WHRI 6310E]|uniref:helix-turn-helix transcriptional regulator n=1 Tax=Leifsonia sp. WHRI 6310E TaxID=3162562 RepID=UPI0035A94B95
MTASKVANETGFAVQTLANWRVLGKGPSFVRIGRSVRYSRDEVDRFMRGDDGEAHTDAEA